ncbi:FecR family protein [Mucilaginibacter pineti]|uniref:FecR family protein n=1 Tax=Mucilaginibacter pineti TaxID=1391627 RepID=A0A1G7ES18_9SPHI|nr:FecR family protein [Mucilaginibacter pineti]SDE66205.1 FecR family protein [Mucilaginibacter pineti]
MDEQQYINTLLEKFTKGKISENELQELIGWYDKFENDPGYTDILNEDSRRQIKQQQFLKVEAKLEIELTAAKPLQLKRQVSLWPRIIVAASLLVFISAGLYFLNKKKADVTETALIEIGNFPAGSNKATLTLANGQLINLTGAKNGQLATQGNTVINKSADGKIVYGKAGEDNSVLINTMTTPRGGTYQLTLSDGTNVWLNAASSITYPSAFKGDTREVEIRGEVYFEIAHNPSKPFRVKGAGQYVEVLGTHFNINTYDGSVSTTLLQGSVRVVAGNNTKIIKPGEQANVTGSEIKVSAVDVDETVAWKNGYFDFTDADIKTVMEQISRWYDVDVVFEGTLSKETFTGRIPRSFDLNKTVKVMQLSKSVKLTVQGRRLMVR